jgi:hypothetical protein
MKEWKVYEEKTRKLTKVPELKRRHCLPSSVRKTRDNERNAESGSGE